MGWAGYAEVIGKIMNACNVSVETLKESVASGDLDVDRMITE
jgi:hypothetical protein